MRSEKSFDEVLWLGKFILGNKQFSLQTNYLIVFTIDICHCFEIEEKSSARVHEIKHENKLNMQITNLKVTSLVEP